MTILFKLVTATAVLLPFWKYFLLDIPTSLHITAKVCELTHLLYFFAF